MNNYLRQTKAPIFGLISILPLLIYYEISMILISQDGGIQIRNAADVLFKRFFTTLGFEGIWGSLVFFMILFISAVLLQGLHHGRHDFRFSWEYYPVMIAESGLYA